MARRPRTAASASGRSASAIWMAAAMRPSMATATDVAPCTGKAGKSQRSLSGLFLYVSRVNTDAWLATGFQ